MSPRPRLRRAGPADLETLAALESRCFGRRDGGFSRAQLRRLLGNSRAYWLMTPDGVAAACWLVAQNGRARWARLYSLAVDPGARGRGLARALVAAGFAWMRGQRLAHCRAEVRAGNRAARTLYARMGFSEVETLRDYYAPGVHGIRLQWPGRE